MVLQEIAHQVVLQVQVEIAHQPAHPVLQVKQVHQETVLQVVHLVLQVIVHQVEQMVLQGIVHLQELQVPQGIALLPVHLVPQEQVIQQVLQVLVVKQAQTEMQVHQV